MSALNLTVCLIVVPVKGSVPLTGTEFLFFSEFEVTRVFCF